MVQVSYPGVYVEEVPSGVRTITGVATSIAAFLGRATTGPINKAVRILSLADYSRKFGAPHPKSDLAQSVRHFFNNGGTECYVVRIAGAGAQKAGVDLKNWARTSVLRATAKMHGQWGNGLRLDVDYNTPSPGETFNMHVIQEEGGRVVTSESFSNLSMDRASPRFAPDFVTQGSQFIDLAQASGFDLDTGSFDGYSEARRPLGASLNDVKAWLAARIKFGTAEGERRFEISVNGSAFVGVDLTDWNVPHASVNTLAKLETQLRDRINQALSTFVPAQTVDISLRKSTEARNQHFLRITSNGGDKASVKVRRAPSQDISAALMLGNDNGGVEMARRSDFRPAPTGSVLRFEDGAGALARLDTFAGLGQDRLTSIQIGSEPAIALNAAPNRIQTTAAGDPIYTDNKPAGSPNGNSDGVREKLQIIAQAISNAAGSRYRAEVHGYQLVILAKQGTFNEQPSGVAFAGPDSANVNPALQLNSRQYTLGPGGTSTFHAFNSATQTGVDGGAPSFADYVGSSVDKSGFHALDTVDLFNLLILPGDEEVDDNVFKLLWGPASTYCKGKRAFLLVDPPKTWTNAEGWPEVVQNVALINDLRATLEKDHSAVFYPNARYAANGNIRSIGPAGATAGLMARTDATRGVWKAPAGIEAGLRDIIALSVELTDAENGVLNKKGVNCLRTFPNGIVNWGARTLDGDDDFGSEWKYIPIRRLALFLEESLYRGTKWVVFEPNDEPLWAKIRLNVGAFMMGLFRQGAFQGASPREAFYVKCDKETTTQDDRNRGIVNIEVGFAPLKPAEFVVIKIQQMTGDL